MSQWLVCNIMRSLQGKKAGIIKCLGDNNKRRSEHVHTTFFYIETFPSNLYTHPFVPLLFCLATNKNLIDGSIQLSRYIQYRMLFNNTFRPSISYVASLDFYVCSWNSSILHLLFVLCEIFRLRKFPSASICQCTNKIAYNIRQSVCTYVSSIFQFFVCVFLDYSIYRVYNDHQHYLYISANVTSSINLRNIAGALIDDHQNQQHHLF